MSILSTARTYKRTLMAHEAHAARQLTAAYQIIWAGILPHVQALQTALQQAQDDGKPVTASAVMRLTQAQNLLTATESSMAHWSQLARGQIETARTYAATLGNTAGHALLHASVPRGVSYVFGVPSPSAIAHLNGAIAPTSPLGKVFRGWGADAATAARSTLLTGLARGQGPRQVARDLARAAEIPLQRALVISRTSMLSSYRDANIENYRANSDVVEQWVWLATLGSACAACTAMHGTKHSLSETMDSHPNCRCTPAPYTRSWSDILGDLGDGIRETRLDVPTGAEWLADQDEATQRRVFGSNAAYNAYADGKASLDDFVGTRSSRQWGDSIYQRSARDVLAS